MAGMKIIEADHRGVATIQCEACGDTMRAPLVVDPHSIKVRETEDGRFLMEWKTKHRLGLGCGGKGKMHNLIIGESE
jgi:hypothetical protein